MIDFPRHAQVGRIIAKENFYDKVDHSTKLLFQSEIARIIWEYKLAPETINISARTWPEIEVFRVDLKNQEIPVKILKAIDSNIPYPILFIIASGTSKKAIIGYKEQNQKNTNTARLDTYFETGWNDPRLDQIKIDGLDVDTVYNNFIRQIAGDKLSAHCDGQSAEADGSSPQPIKDELNQMKEREKVQKQIATIDRRIRAEPSIGKKQKLAEERHELLELLK